MADDDDTRTATPRPFWSGTIAFGLVSLPVSLHAAHRGRPVSLKMVDEDGTPLARRYFCEKDGKPLSRDDIVRGYAVDKQTYVLVEDDELEAAAPGKTREIDLTRFVRLEQIDPMFFERAYFLIPEQGATKAYRLLAEAMEDEGRAGIATFVMREREYLAAIVAEHGILRVETLRFADELRSPEQIGLPAVARPPKPMVSDMRDAIDAHADERFERDELHDPYAQRLLAHVEDKLAAGDDVLEPAVAIDLPDDEDAGNIVDLMQVLKQRLQGGDGGTRRAPAEPARRDTPAPRRSAKARRAEPQAGGRPRRTRTPAAELAQLSKDELYERAQQLHIAGRSQMSKAELISALGRQH